MKGKKKFTAKFYGENNKKIELDDEKTTKAIFNEIEKSRFTVTNIKESPKKRSPEPPFITSTLQQEASRKLNFTTVRTMQAAQQLYEGVNIKGKGQIGLITYMRTDSLRIADDARAEAEAYIKENYGKEFYPASPKIYKTKKNAQDAHEAIRPSYIDINPESIKTSLSSDQYKIYKLIWERFMASQMSDAIYDTVSVTINADKYQFKANGSSIKFAGFTLVYTESKDEDEQKETKLPLLEEGEELKLDKLIPEQHFTQPPSRYTEAALIKILEEKGIGRPSTYSPTITTIIARGYITRSKKTLFPTELGMIVNNIISEHFKDIVDVTFTADMENNLDMVEEGKADWHKIIDDFYQPFKLTLEEAEEKIGNVEIKDEVSDVVCEKCGALMVYKQGKFGKFLACPSFPECRNTKTIVKEIGIKCPKCDGQVIEKKSRRGKVFYGCSQFPECDFTSWDKPVDKICEKCGAVMFEKSGRIKKIYCAACEEEKLSKKGDK